MMSIVKAQFWVTGGLAILAWFFGSTLGLSALLGGATVAIPGLFMAWRLNRPVAQASVAFAVMLNAELGKLVLTGSLIVMSFVLVPSIEVKAFFLAMILGLACNVAVPMAMTLKSNRASEK